MANKKSVKKNKKKINLRKKNFSLMKNPILWMAVSGIFGLLLLVSVYTEGFGIMQKNSVNTLIDDLQKLQEKTTDSQLKNVLSSVKGNLEPYKEIEKIEKENFDVFEKVKVDFYVMSQCPYGTQVEDAIYPVLEKMGDYIDFNLEFIVTEVSQGNFQSLHGQNEVLGNIVQLCAAEINPDKYMDMVICQNKNMGNIPDNWEKCAKDNGLDVDSIKACYEGDEGKKLLSESALRAQAVNARGSPTIYLNNESYTGGRSEKDFMRAICNAFSDKRPEVCSDIPEPVKVDLKIIVDKECTSCSYSQLLTALKNIFPGLEKTIIDVNTDEGKALVEDYSIKYAPGFVLSSNIEKVDNYAKNPQLQAAFEKVGEDYKIKDSASGSSWIIDKEQREAFLKEIGIEKGDNKPQIDFFVMSYCPYGNQAEELIEPVYQEFKDDAIFKPRYVIYSNYAGGGPKYCLDEDSNYCSMHGIQELNQNIRELCVEEKYGMDEWFKFAMEMNDKCNYNNADTCYEDVATELGYDIEYIKTCELERGLEFVRRDFEIGNKLGVSGSPTVFIEGVQYSGPRSSNGYMTALCSEFEDAPEACNMVEFEESSGTVPEGQC